MGAPWFDLGIVLALVAFNALLSGTEMALVSLRPVRLDALAAESERGRRVAALAQTPSRYLSALQLGITLAGFLASASAAVELSASVEPWLSFLGGSAEASAVIAVTIFVSMLTLVFGELVPKRVAMLRAEQWSLLAVVPLGWFMRAVGPVLRLLELVTEGVLTAIGSRSAGENVVMGNDDLKRLIAREPSLEPVQRQILFEAIAVADRTLRQILVPRPLVVSVDAASRSTRRSAECGRRECPGLR